MKKLIVLFAVLLSLGNAYSQSSKHFRTEFLNSINATRQKGCNCGSKYFPPAPPLTWNDDLEDAAIGHAKDMARKSYFSHDSKDGRSMEDRIVYALSLIHI